MKDECIDMIKSLLCYTYDLKEDTRIIANNEYLSKYVKILGLKMVKNLIDTIKNTIKSIERNVYTDAEGCSYNSIIYKK